MVAAVSKKFRPAKPGETILDIEARRLAAPPAGNERLQLSVGLRIGIGEGHRLPAGTPGAANVVAPNLTVAEQGPAHHNPRRLHHPGVRRRDDGEGEQQRGKGERYAFHRKSPVQSLRCRKEEVHRRAASIVSRGDYASENGGDDAADSGIILSPSPTLPVAKESGCRSHAS